MVTGFEFQNYGFVLRNCRLRAPGPGRRVSRSGFSGKSVGFRVPSSGSRFQGYGFQIPGLVFRVYSPGLGPARSLRKSSLL